MQNHLEIEYKTLISYEDYHKLLKSFPFAKESKQVNSYYDYHDVLFQNKKMLRLRELEDELLITLKIPQANGVQEIEMAAQSQDDLLAFIKVQGFDFPALDQVGQSITYRNEYRDSYGIWCLDRTQFHWGCDYELEYELYAEHPDAYKHYRRILKNLAIPYKKAPAKYLRARYSSL